MEDVPVDFRHLDLSVSLVPTADEVYANVTQAREDQKPEQFTVLDISLDTVEDVLRQIHEEEHVEDLLYRVLEERERQQKPIRVPHLFQRVSELFECVIFFLFVFRHVRKTCPLATFNLYYHAFPRQMQFLYRVDNTFFRVIMCSETHIRQEGYCEEI